MSPTESKGAAATSSHSLLYKMNKQSKKQLHSMSRLQKQRRDIDDILWRVTAGGAGMVKFYNEDLGEDSVVMVSSREEGTLSSIAR